MTRVFLANYKPLNFYMQFLYEKLALIFTSSCSSFEFVTGFNWQDHCKQHFEEEERELLPLMEATELSREQQEKVLEQCLDVMQGTHSHLFRFFMEGLLPLDALQYLDMVIASGNKERVASMLRVIVE